MYGNLKLLWKVIGLAVIQVLMRVMHDVPRVCERMMMMMMIGIWCGDLLKGAAGTRQKKNLFLKNSKDHMNVFGHLGMHTVVWSRHFFILSFCRSPSTSPLLRFCQQHKLHASSPFTFSVDAALSQNLIVLHREPMPLSLTFTLVSMCVSKCVLQVDKKNNVPN